MSPERIAACALPLSWIAVGLARRYAVARDVLDRPTARSSHSIPTPRGGGIGVVASVLIAGGVGLVHAGVPPILVALGAIAVVAVAYVGWRDDRASLSVRVRLAVHLLAAAAVAGMALAAGVPDPRETMAPAVVGSALWWAFWTVSAINVVNFIDGIDGLIGSQMMVFGAYVALASPADSASRVLGLALATASTAFLYWNWSPAKIFLGDVGSGAYGVLAVLTGMALMASTDASLLRAFLPLAPIFLDAAATLVRRARAGERLTVAHRSHLYQRLANGPWSHALTAATYAAASVIGAAIALLGRGWVGFVADVAYVTALAGAAWQLERRLAPWPATENVGAERSASGRAR